MRGVKARKLNDKLQKYPIFSLLTPDGTITDLNINGKDVKVCVK